jgi:hypothetical protein
MSPAARAACVALLALVLAGGVMLAAGRGAPPPAACAGLLVPAYVRPDALWRLAQDASPSLIVVVNPSSGPGREREPAYARAIERIRGRGARVLGYVATGYGARDAAAVSADVRRYAGWYGVDGIFLDESAAGAQDVAHYRALAADVRSATGGLVVLNPGLVPARAYFDVADVVVTFEGPHTDYEAAVRRMPAWLASVPSERVAHLVYGASAEQARERPAPRGAGHVYLSTGDLPNPWATVAGVASPETGERCRPLP